MEYNHQSIQDEIWMVLYLFLFFQLQLIDTIPTP